MSRATLGPTAAASSATMHVRVPAFATDAASHATNICARVSCIALWIIVARRKYASRYDLCRPAAADVDEHRVEVHLGQQCLLR